MALVPKPVVNLRGDQRRQARRPTQFVVRVYSGVGNSRGAFLCTATAQDLSERGLLVQVPPGVKLPDRFMADFRVPFGTLPDRYVHRVRVACRVTRREQVTIEDGRVTAAGGLGTVKDGIVTVEDGIVTEQCGVQFLKSLDTVLAGTVWPGLATLGAILFFFGAVNAVLLKTLAVEYFWHSIALTIYGLVVTAYILSRFLIAALYRPPVDSGLRPTVSVIVACKNEEAHIARVLELAYECDYPPELLEVIAVDDGSTDGTYAAMERVKAVHPGLQLIRFETNLGKRHGMAAGARAATGEILVYLDSDSFLERDALLHVVQGFADPAVAAVCAHGFVANSWTNWLTRMQTVQYFVAFRILKAAESVFGCVTCCSGCCAAYRRSVVLSVLDPWLNQTFLGQPATFGDDRSLTNRMLRHHRVIYDSTAHVSTIVPDRLRVFLRQQLRWKKSWLRETLLAARFMWRKPPVMALSFFAGFFFPVLAPLVLTRTLILLPLLEGRVNLFYLWGVFLMSLLYAAVYLILQKNRLWVYGFCLCILYSLVLTWQLPWAIVTSWNNKWGTR